MRWLTHIKWEEHNFWLKNQMLNSNTKLHWDNISTYAQNVVVVVVGYLRLQVTILQIGFIRLWKREHKYKINDKKTFYKSDIVMFYRSTTKLINNK